MFKYKGLPTNITFLDVRLSTMMKSSIKIVVSMIGVGIRKALSL
jgi:hypothetical protein